MNTKEKIIQKLESEIKDRQEQIQKVLKVEALDKLEMDAYFFNNTHIDFDHKNHDEVIQIIKAIGGKWNKTPSGEGRVDYETEVAGLKLRCYQGEPPPNCKIVEVLETIPAQPEKVITRRKLVCQ